MRRTLPLLLALIAAPATASLSVRDLVEMADLSGLVISPDGRDVAYRIEKPSIGGNDTPSAWYVVAVDGSQSPRRIGDGGEVTFTEGTADVAFPRWSADSRWIYYRALIDGQVQVWRAARDGSAQEQVTHDAADVEAFDIDRTHNLLVYRVGASREAIARAEAAEHDHGVVIDASIDPAMALYHGSIVNGRPTSVRVTGHWFQHGGVLEAVARHVHAIDLATLIERPADGIDPSGIADPLQAYIEDKDGYIRSEAASGDARGGVSVRLDGLDRTLVVTRPDGTHIPCRARACVGVALDLVQWVADRDMVLFSSNDGETERLFVWSVGAPAARFIAEIPGQLDGERAHRFPCAVAERVAVCVHASATQPPRLEAINLARGKRKILDDPNAALTAGGLPRHEALRWTDPAGQVFTGHLFLPPRSARERVPLFLTYYSCEGFIRGGTGDEFPLIPLANQGIAALCINRTRAAPGGNDNVDQYRYALSGITTIVDQLDQRGIIDRRRIGMGGLSFGGEVTAWTVLHSDLLAAASISSTLFEPTYWWFNGVAGRDIHKGARDMWGLGAPDETPDRWKLLSPAMNVDRFGVPLLMQMPEQEFRLNMEFFSRLSEASKPAELVAFPEEPHVKFQPRHKLAVYQRNLDWFRYWLLGEVDPDPAKADQYRRWQAFARKPVTTAQGAPSQSRSQISISTSDRIRK